MVRQLRDKYGLTQRGLGDMLGVTSNAVALWEAGRRNPSECAKRLMERIAKDLERKRRAQIRAKN